MKKILLPLLISSFALPAFAEIDRTVVASINGKDVIAQELIMTAEQNKIDYTTLNDMQKQALLSGLINRILVASEARKMKIDTDPETKLRLDALIDSVLAASLLEKKTTELKVSDDEIKKHYESTIKTDKQKQYKARHILVKEEDEAKKLAKELTDVKSFSAKAMEKSIDKGSAIKGGDLGWFNPATMVPEFAEAVKKAEIGKVSQPVKSQFGWHIILVEESKDIEPPSLEDSKTKISQLLTKKKVSEYLETLKKKYDIEVKLAK